MAMSPDGAQDKAAPLPRDGLGATEFDQAASALPPAPGWAGRRRHAAAGWWAAAPSNLRGSVLMVAAFAVFSVMTVSIKLIGTRVPLPEVLLIRQVIMTVLLLPLFYSDLPGVLRTKHLGLQLLRGVCSLGAMLLGFTALLHIPLADVTAIGFSQVLFVTVGAVLILKEVVRPSRWLATAVGFVGVLIMLRPGSSDFNHYYLLALAGAMFGSGITITVRVLAQSERTETILVYQALVLIVALSIPTVIWWVTPTPREWMLILLIGVFGTLGQYLITKAYQIGEASALAPLDFTRLLMASVLGYLVFAELPALASLTGALLVVGATVYTVRSNAR
jgi:drug/metabolite transporter (DMT)-like permease